MMKAIASLAALTFATLALAACEQKNPNLAAGPQAAAPAQPAAPKAPATPPATASKIDWEKARADLGKNRPADAPATVQSVGEQGPPAVPMLLPSGIASTQSDRPTPPRMMKDGYFATYHLPKYDVTVNGSNASRPAAGQTATGNKETMRFTTVEGGASLAFSRYGADYLIDFECRQIDGAKSCVTEQEAKDFADGLFVAQTQ